MKKDAQSSLKAAGYALVCLGLFVLIYATYSVFQILSGDFDLPYASLFQDILRTDNGIYRISGEFAESQNNFNIEISAGLGIFLLAISFGIVVTSFASIASVAISSGVKMISPPEYWEKRTHGSKTNLSD